MFCKLHKFPKKTFEMKFFFRKIANLHAKFVQSNEYSLDPEHVNNIET